MDEKTILSIIGTLVYFPLNDKIWFKLEWFFLLQYIVNMLIRF